PCAALGFHCDHYRVDLRHIDDNILCRVHSRCCSRCPHRLLEGSHRHDVFTCDFRFLADCDVSIRSDCSSAHQCQRRDGDHFVPCQMGSVRSGSACVPDHVHDAPDI